MHRFARSLALHALALAALATSAFADSYKVDPVHSSVAFKIKHNNVSNIYGTFAAPVGTVNLTADGGSIDISVKADSVNTRNEKRDEHLKGNDFFAVSQFPTISFKSTKVTKTDGGYSVVGNLTLHGVTKEVTLTLAASEEAKGMQGGTVRGFETTFTIKRSDFGMTGMVGPIGDEVTLMIGLETAKQ